MRQVYRVPIRVGGRPVQNPAPGAVAEERRAQVAEPQPPVVSAAEPAVMAQAVAAPDTAAPRVVERAAEEAREARAALTAAQEESEKWRDQALRLRAEMENFRKRQQRLAEEQLQAEREHLLLSLLNVVDNLDRALAVDAADTALHHGVELTRDELLRVLRNQGVVPVDAAQGQPFDPFWHEAISTVPAAPGTEPGTIANVAQPGYRMAERLLRPARVIVAQP